MTEFLLPVAAGAVLFAACVLGLRWLYENALGWQPRRAQAALEACYRPAIASHPAEPAAPRAVTSGPRVVRGVVLERGKVQL